MSSQAENPVPRARLTQLFEYLKAYTDLRYPPVRDVRNQLGTLWLNELPPHSSIGLRRDAEDATDEGDDAGVVLRLTRPTPTPCPAPPAALVDWLNPGWRDFAGTVDVQASRNVLGRDGKTRFERFEADSERATLLRSWQQQRDEWVRNERPVRAAMGFFQRVYEWYGTAEREGERIELLVADGLLRCPAADGVFHHPVLLQKLELEFYPESRQPQFVFRKREQPPELYMEFLRALPDVNIEQLGKCAHELKEAEFSPLGEEDTSGFLQRLIQGLFPKAGSMIHAESSAMGGRVPEPQPSLFDAAAIDGDAPTLERQPLIFMRQRRTGPGNVFDLVLEDIASRADFSSALLQMLGLVSALGPNAETGEERPPTHGNEDDAVLLGKPANREQLEIAKQLGRRDCVLVQGPPGTGKTHTIANLLGHLLAQGKRVLVTAHTPKALRVLRQKVVEPLQPLCVSVLHNDKPSQEELQMSVRKIHLRLSEDERLLDRDAQRLKAERSRILKALRETRGQLLDARQDEIREVVFSGKSIRPVEAAKLVKAGAGKHDWIPGPVEPGASLPLAHAEIVALYQSNVRVSPADERELGASRPDLGSLPTPAEFQQAMGEIADLDGQNLRLREELWDDGRAPSDLAAFDRMLELAGKTIEFLRESAVWQQEAIQAGRDGDQASRVWESLVDQIESGWREVQECHALVMEHGPVVSDPRGPHELVPLLDEIIQHAEAGNSFGLLTKLTKRSWFEFKEKVRVGNRVLNLEEVTHLRAVRALLRLRQVRLTLADRWERQMEQRGGISCAELGERPEQVCKQFVPQIRVALAWHNSTWKVLENEFEQLGFRWSAFLESAPPEPGDNAELRRMRRAIIDGLGPILQSRSGCLRRRHLQTMLQTWRQSLRSSVGAEAKAAQQLRQGLRDASSTDYRAAYDELARLKSLENDLVWRRSSLARLIATAPAWASAVENRIPQHAHAEPPGDPQAAWEWRQLYEELERRAATSFHELQQRVEHLNTQLLEVTSQLIEKQTWANQIRQTGPVQKQALGAYALARSKLTKSGTGVRDAELRAVARREMSLAKDAVPVWIMPLAEVAETFDPRATRFDVVIIDEASQCDPTSLFAVYLGRQTIVVGDDEQVSPVAVGEKSEEVVKLINTYLAGVPHKEFYDGSTSIYDLAQISFTPIRLTEHFRCAPNIIAFSNALSYKGEVKPLREASSIPLRPHVVPYRVRDGRDRSDNVNDIEAEVIASLICAAIQQPEYAKSDTGEPTTFGAVSLVGDRQALKIDTILRQHLPPTEYRRRQILCGDSAQFQGDERDVMFLSIVDSPPAQPPLSMRQEGPRKIFKKRFNVAASRARNQMWVVHSLNHESDLQAGDYRRRLIEHSLDPQAWERELLQRMAKVDPRSKVFEGTVLRRLMERGYHVLPQFQAGAFSIDLVVIGAGRRLAIECDGEQFHGREQLQDDLARQAVLERLGWIFVRIRGSIFFREEDRALEPVFRRLEELGIPPELKTPAKPESEARNEVVERVIREAEKLRAVWRAEAPGEGEAESTNEAGWHARGEWSSPPRGAAETATESESNPRTPTQRALLNLVGQATPTNPVSSTPKLSG